MFISEIIGNIGNDASIVDIKGRKYISFSVAHTIKRMTEDGTPSETTQWISCLMYGEGGKMFQYLKRGTKVFVRGRTSIKVFQRRTGECDAGINIDVTELQLCGGSKVESMQHQGGMPFVQKTHDPLSWDVQPQSKPQQIDDEPI